ncbi:PEP-CTERM domain protein [Oopsacas minuta]|uniref:PEP-CTERM domain protein n=1 Tax=Oopsacas minuta TaxID=111878 RepID=A0AAV7K2W1_9METZ|nr:PEP-CTERM domain protein [Oopsacas minuta]
MATVAVGPEIEPLEDSIERIKAEVRGKFAEFVERVLAREAALLVKLDDIFAIRRAQIEEFQGRKRELEEMRNQNKSNLRYEELRSMQSEFMNKIETKIKELEHQLVNSFVHFDWSSNIFNELSELGNLHVLDKYTLTPKVEYTHKQEVALKRSKVGDLEGELYGPRVICIDPKSNNIFISEHKNNRVQKFDRNGNYLTTLGNGKMKAPDGIAIHNDQIYIAQYEGNHVQVYSLLTDKFVGRIGEKGFGRGQLDCPTGLAISKKNSYLYVCDRKNCRVQVFEQGGEYRSKFGSENLNNPTDIKMTGEEIFVLDEANPCIHVFNYANECVRSLITNGPREQTLDPFCFCFDLDRNFYITDFDRNCVSIFNPIGESLGQIGSHTSRVLYTPSGIAIDMLGRLIVIDRSNNGCIRFF